jgi:pimeloyl-ACP methyl ester carboxylesterase
VDESGAFSHPDRFGRNAFSVELGDIRRIVDALAAGTLGVAPPSSIGIVGHSRGGGLGILAAEADPRVRALVTWAAISTVARWPAPEVAAWRASGRLMQRNSRTGDTFWLERSVLDDIEAHQHDSLDIAAAARRLTIPWLLIHGVDDAAVPIDEAEALHAARPEATALYIEGTGHTFGAVHPWAGTTPALDQVTEATIRWLGRHLA